MMCWCGLVALVVTWILVDIMYRPRGGYGFDRMRFVHGFGVIELVVLDILIIHMGGSMGLARASG
jgi:hypothetical protein